MANRISEVSLITNTNGGQQDYYIEPLMYAGTTSGTSSAYTISLANFEVVNGASLQLTFNSRNSAGATLSVNGSSPVTIYYNGESVAANQIKDQSTHTLIFKSDSNGNRWIIADSDTTYSAGTGLDLTGNTFSVKYGTTAGTAAAGNDSRLSDARTPTAHTHGYIKNDGTLDTASRAVVTDGNKKITVVDLTFADPSASTTDTSLNFIDTISQDSQGKISATKKSLPKVSATSDGIVPKGATVSTQSTSTKFLREDGTWAAPSYITNITRSGTTFTVTRNDDSTFTFTQQDTNKYHKSGSWSGLTYTATAVNSADELKFTIPNKIQTNWELNATSGNSPALLFTRNSSLTDWKIFVTSGKLSFQSATDGSTWTERAYFKDNSGDFVATSFTGNGSNLTDLNASNISSGTLNADRLATSGATAGSYGPSANVSGSNGTTMNVPYITVDDKGRVTAISDKVYTAVNTWRPIGTGANDAAAGNHNHDGSYLSLSGSTMDGTAQIKWADSGTWSNSSAAMPVKRGGLYWSGTSDWIELFAEETGRDKLNLIIDVGDDASPSLILRNKGTDAITLTPGNGTVSATSFSGSGASLTSLNASNLASGTVPADRLPIATNSAFGVVQTGNGITNTDGVISVTASNLGLSNAMHFIGIANKAITDGGTEDPTIDGYSTKTAGDVVIDKDTRREYVWSTANKWELLGFDASTKYEETTSGNTFISKITQATDGTITAESRALVTSGEWSGNAATATAANITPTTNSFAFYTNTAGKFGHTSGYVRYLNHTAITAGTSSTAKYIDGISITGTAFNAAADVTSGVDGVLSYGDAGPQIRFTDVDQSGVLLFHRWNNGSSTVSFNFLSNQGGEGALVRAGCLMANTRAYIGYNTLDTNYTLKVNGAAYINGATTINGNLIFPTANVLDWNSDTYRQRIAITDDSTANTAVFTFQQSTDSGSNYTDLFTIKDNGTVVATTFDGNASTATKSGTATMWLYPENSNEINFGGTNTNKTLYIGYRAKDSRSIPTKFIFGGSTGTADLQAKTVYLGSGTTSYISSTQYTGNAATATTASKLTATEGTGNYSRPIWFSYQSGGTIDNSKQAYNTNFAYNPSTRVLSFSDSATIETDANDLTLSSANYLYLSNKNTMYITNGANTSLIFRRNNNNTITEYARFNSSANLIIGAPSNPNSITSKLYVDGNTEIDGTLTMSGQIKTSFKSSIATGSYGSSQGTVPNLIEEVKLSSGCMGSVNITTAYTLNNITIPKGWYNFEYIPHRSGGVDGVASGDNCKYGVLYLHCMNHSEYQNYIVAFNSDAIKKVQVLGTFISTITDGQVVISDGTSGMIKTSGYTIAKSVPSDAKFTDTNTTYTIATGDANGQIKVTPSSGGGDAYNVSVKGLAALAYKASLSYSDVGAAPAVDGGYLPLSGGTMTGDIKGDQKVALGTTANPFNHIVLGGTTSATMTAASTNPHITFQEKTGTQPVHLIYTDVDAYRHPAGLKIIGGASATPAWLEVEGDTWSAGFKITGKTTSLTDNNLTFSQGGGWYMNDATWIRTLGDKSIYQNSGTMRTDGTFQVGQSGKYVSFSSTGIKLGDTTAASNGAQLTTINGHVVINSAKNTSNSWNEGLRINNGSNNWSTLTLGGDDETTKDSSKATWSLHAHRNDTTNKISQFYLSYNGSNGAATRITGHANTSGGIGFSIRPHLGIAVDPDTNYALKVSGDSSFTGDLSISDELTAANGIFSNTSTTFSSPILTVKNTSDATWIPTGGFIAPNIATSHWVAIEIGKALEDKNCGHLSFYYAGNKSTSNRFELGFYNVTSILNVRADRKVGINTTAPSHDLSVDGDTASTTFIVTDGASTPNDKVTLQWNSTDSSLDFIFA